MYSNVKYRVQNIMYHVSSATIRNILRLMIPVAEMKPYDGEEMKHSQSLTKDRSVCWKG